MRQRTRFIDSFSKQPLGGQVNLFVMNYDAHFCVSYQTGTKDVASADSRSESKQTKYFGHLVAEK